MKQLLDFTNLEEFISHLKSKDEIIGIVQYGNRDYKNMCPGGDYDLNLILDKQFQTPIGGLHFHINSIPVDCGIISINDLYMDSSPSDFHSILIKSLVLHDPTGEISKQLNKIKSIWKFNIIPIKEGEIEFERFIKQHVVDKFENRLFENEVYTRIFLSGNIFSLLEDYMKINKLDPYDFKTALKSMEETDNKTYKLFEDFVSTHDLHKQMFITKQLNNEVLHKIGGTWKNDEAVFHYKNFSDSINDEDKQKIIQLVF